MKWIKWAATERGPRAVLLVTLDAFIGVLSLALAFLIRFDGRVPADYVALCVKLMPGFALIRAGVTYFFGLHRWSFRMSGLSEAVRLLVAALLGSTLVAVFRAVVGPLELPRSVIAIDFLIAALGMVAYRFVPRLAASWVLEHRRRPSSRVALIVGAGSAGELLLRDLLRSPTNPYKVAAFLDDDVNKLGTHIGGRVVMGTVADLPKVAARCGATDVLIAIPRVSSERVRAILGLCSSQALSFKIIPASFAVLDEKISAAMLHDLTPEDLLPREQVRFDRRETGRLVAGARVMITGAAGSIGSEIARQIAAFRPATLLLSDINENELYLLERSLSESHADVKIVTRIADIRDASRMLRLGDEFRPQFVFHAAAHKHVPLMEEAPDEAVKNNVFGTLNVAKMADQCGAERFVLISTDKAVSPSSVMGATKRIAELVVRDIASRSKTRFTAVRFGNVLGSAGSVVPLFKQQIARGGPVTVTHRDCTRYFMTIPEAVGLVVQAGLSGYGELCILDMGEPIRIADLAANLITMAGLVPGKDIDIVFTGLRPGEKLNETLLSEEEESTSEVRDGIFVARSPAPPTDFSLRLEVLRTVTADAEPDLIKAHLQALVPTYRLPTSARGTRAA